MIIEVNFNTKSDVFLSINETRKLMQGENKCNALFYPTPLPMRIALQDYILAKAYINKYEEENVNAMYLSI